MRFANPGATCTHASIGHTRHRSGRTAQAGPAVTGAELFWQLAAELQAENPDLVEGTIMKGRCLRVRGEFVALADFKDAGLVAKLSRQRVDALIAGGAGRPFAPAGRVFREWVSLPVADRQAWLLVLREAVAHASARVGEISGR